MTTAGIEKYRFMSPGIKTSEIDNSQPSSLPEDMGPVVIGRARRGPALRPVQVSSAEQLIEIFGEPIPGGEGNDVWRNGNALAPTYGMYGALGYLQSAGPLTYVRLLGAEHQDATANGQAGWQVGTTPSTSPTAGGAYGLFILDKTVGVEQGTGSLAAVFYLSEGSVELSGTSRDGSTNVTGTAVLIESVGSDKEFKLLFRDDAGAIVDNISVNFNTTSQKYIRKVLNTNPTLTNDRITRSNQLKTYFLGETYDRHLASQVTTSTAGNQYGIILALTSGSADAVSQNINRMELQKAESGWVISQHLGSAGTFDPTSATSVTRLFKVKALEGGEWESKNLKVSISDIKEPANPDVDPYGTFSVLIRDAKDSDGSPRVLEQYNGCNLNPNSPNYVARKVGDSYVEWDDVERRFREFGEYANQSKYVYVEMNPDVDAGVASPTLVPFGFLGPVKFKGFALTSGSATVGTLGDPTTPFAGVFAAGNDEIIRSKGDAAQFALVGTGSFTGSFVFPELSLRSSTIDSTLAGPKDAFFGIDTSRAASARFEPSYADLVRPLPGGISADPGSNASLEYSFAFSLDDVRRSTTGGGSEASWAEGNRLAGLSFTAETGSWGAVLDAGFNKFTMPLVGGFDGVDITEKEPFNNTQMDGLDQLNSYSFNSVKRAVDSVGDREVVECDAISAPGLYASNVTDHILNVAARRQDCLAVIDTAGNYVPSTENTNASDSTANRGAVSTAVSSIKTRALNTSYGATYYNWVQIRDVNTNSLLWVPPSVVALGVLASTKKSTEVWFAPAGYTRGNLTAGAAGLPVVNAKERLRETDRDALYEVNINPIVKFPAGIYIFGQKTLQATASSLDRINVRRLMNFVKVGVEKRARNILFDPNNAITWDRFRNSIDPFLADVKARFGLQDYKIVLDETTTTPDLVDRNILYAKILLKPERAIEFIAIDFVLQNSMVGFDD